MSLHCRLSVPKRYSPWRLAGTEDEGREAAASRGRVANRHVLVRSQDLEAAEVIDRRCHYESVMGTGRDERRLRATGRTSKRIILTIFSNANEKVRLAEQLS